MKTNIYTVYDSCAKIYSSPIMLLNDEVAVRVMKNCVNTPDHNYALNPEDYSLHKLGTFDDNTSELKLENTKICGLSSLTPPKNIKEAI